MIIGILRMQLCAALLLLENQNLSQKSKLEKYSLKKNDKKGGDFDIRKPMRFFVRGKRGDDI